LRVGSTLHGSGVRPGCPVGLLEEQGTRRVQELAPLRYGRMKPPRSRSIAVPPI
jgi:hypothetical protein